jgi:putative hemolysin
MNVVSRAASPLVWVLTGSTGLVMRMLKLKASDEPPVTEAEIAVLLEQGTQAGVFDEEEQDLVERVFWLGDQRVVNLMTPRHRVKWLDVNDAPETNRARMVAQPLTRYLMCDGVLDKVVGIVEAKDLWAAGLSGQAVDDLRAYLKQPLFVPESTRALRVLELFRESGVHLAVVVNEYGGTEGLVTLNNVLEEITGDMAGASGSPPIVRRDDGSVLVDASLSIDEFREALDLPERRDEDREYRTVGGFIFTTLGHVPRAGDHFTSEGHRIEVVDMDGNRIDKILVFPPPRPRPQDASPDE